jgi:transcriptional regulator with XRE-family HTH domain
MLVERCTYGSGEREATLKLSRRRQEREQAGLTQRELATAAGVRRLTVVRVERSFDARPGTARRQALALGVAIPELLPREASDWANAYGGER